MFGGVYLLLFQYEYYYLIVVAWRTAALKSLIFQFLSFKT